MNQQILEAKKATVSEISESLKGAASMTVVSYQGLTVAELQELRRTLAKEDASFSVYKNTLVRRAISESGYAELGEMLEGPNGFVFSKDLSKGPKALTKFSRYHENLVIKGGLFEGRVAGADDVKVYAKLPDKNGMISMFLSCLNAPITKFAATIKAIADK